MEGVAVTLVKGEPPGIVKARQLNERNACPEIPSTAMTFSWTV
jgi:hypothetical protein